MGNLWEETVISEKRVAGQIMLRSKTTVITKAFLGEIKMSAKYSSPTLLLKSWSNYENGKLKQSHVLEFRNLANLISILCFAH